jgi:hypothetical protein
MQTLEERSEGIKTLTGIDEARSRLNLSRSFLYRLPPDTPGVYVLGRSKRFCVEELQAWARKQAEEKAVK